MSGTSAGGRKAEATNKRLYGKDFYKKIGKKGGEISQGGGFASSHDLAVEAGRKGGAAMRRNAVLRRDAEQQKRDALFASDEPAPAPPPPTPPLPPSAPPKPKWGGFFLNRKPSPYRKEIE